MGEYNIRVPASLTPITAYISGEPVFIAPDIIPLAVNGTADATAYQNCVSGVFSDKLRCISILIAWGKIIRSEACHNHVGYPESVLCRMADGSCQIHRVKTASELPHGVIHAVGGLGLLDSYAPEVEGFVKGHGYDYTDVLRRTSHTWIGYKGGLWWLGYVEKMNAKELNDYVTSLEMEKAVCMDGGHFAAIFGTGVKKNLYTRQACIVQGVRV